MANKVYQNDETTISFGDEVGDDVVWTNASMATGSQDQSAQADLGAAPRATRYRWRFYCQCVATPTVGNVLTLYLKTSDGTHADNDDGTSDGAVSSSDKLRNLKPLGYVECDEAAANVEFGASGVVEIYDRYVQVVADQQLGANLTSDDTECKFLLTPIPPEVQ